MSNSNQPDRSRLQNFERMNETTAKLLELTTGMLAAAKADDWQTFRDLTGQRVPYFEEIQALKNLAIRSESVDNTSETARIDKLRENIREEFKKVAKVDAEIFDTINNKKQDLVHQMNEFQQGMVFLKRYSSQVNQERVISKVI